VADVFDVGLLRPQLLEPTLRVQQGTPWW
jgi:hypothetical protein